MSKLEDVKQLLKEMSEDDRLKVDQFLLGQLADDAEERRKRYQIEVASDYLEAAKQLRANWGKMQGISCGYPSIDKLTHGLVGGEVVVVAGPTSHGKTSLAVNMTAHIVSGGPSVLFVTMEMTKAQLTSRLLYADEQFENNSALVAFQKRDDLDWKSIDGLIYNAVKELRVGLVVIDHLHYFSRELERLSEDLGRITKEFKRCALEYDIPVLLISHIRKLQKPDSQPDIDDLRGSSYIAQDADIVLMVNQNPQVPGQLMVKCLKNRNRGVDFADNKVLLNFDKTRITERSLDPWNTSARY